MPLPKRQFLAKFEMDYSVAPFGDRGKYEDMYRFVIFGLTLFVLIFITLAVVRNPFVCIHYPKWDGDAPMPDAEEITSRSATTLVLKGGKVVRLDPTAHPLESATRAKLSVGDLVKIDETGMLYCRQEMFRCGTPYVALINIPIIEDRFYRYVVRPLCAVTVEQSSPTKP
jgi:hypothetical protein